MEDPLEIPQEQSEVFTPVQTINIGLDELGSTDTRFLDTLASTERHRNALKADSRGVFQPEIKLTASFDSNSCSEESLASSEDDLDTGYRNLLLRDSNARRLIHKFREETYELVASSASKVTFGLQDCYHRLASGHDVQLLNYLTLDLEDYRVYATPEGLEWKQRSTSKSFVKYSEMGGILIGSRSAGFESFQVHGYDLKTYSYSEVDCMTILTDYRSYDICIDDDTIKYDIYLLVAWQISARSVKTSIIPLTKGQLAVCKIKMKLEIMARTRCLFVDELLLLGIVKSLYSSSKNPEFDPRIQLVQNILNRKFNLSQKIYRIIRRMKPKNFLMPKTYAEKFRDSQRVLELQRRMGDRIESSKRNYSVSLLKWQSIRKTLISLPSVLRKAMKTSKQVEKLTEEQEYARTSLLKAN